MRQKNDEQKFHSLFSAIRLKEGHGVLAFLTSEILDVENFLIKRIMVEFKEEYEVDLIPITAENYCPFNVIRKKQTVPQKTIFIFNSFPYKDYYDSPNAYEEKIERLLSSFNILRSIIPENRLKCIIILPKQLEDRIALHAPDFYHFKTFSAYFNVNSLYSNHILSTIKVDQRKMERIKFLDNSLDLVKGDDVKGLIYFELASIYYQLSEFKSALNNWKIAENLFYKINDKRNLGYVSNNLGQLYKDLEQLDLALRYYKNAERIFREISLDTQANESLKMQNSIKRQIKK